MKPGDLPKKVPSADGQLPVPPKEEQSQARTGGSTICGRGRGRGDLVPSRSLTQLAENSKADSQSSCPPVLQRNQPVSDQPRRVNPSSSLAFSI